MCAPETRTTPSLRPQCPQPLPTWHLQQRRGAAGRGDKPVISALGTDPRGGNLAPGTRFFPSMGLLRTTSTRPDGAKAGSGAHGRRVQSAGRTPGQRRCSKSVRAAGGAGTEGPGHQPWKPHAQRLRPWKAPSERADGAAVSALRGSGRPQTASRVRPLRPALVHPAPPSRPRSPRPSPRLDHRPPGDTQALPQETHRSHIIASNRTRESEPSLRRQGPKRSPVGAHGSDLSPPAALLTGGTAAPSLPRRKEPVCAPPLGPRSPALCLGEQAGPPPPPPPRVASLRFDQTQGRETLREHF